MQQRRKAPRRLVAAGARVNVSFVGTAFSETGLLADAYAYEQATSLRRAPSFTNPSLWRCVPASAFPPHSCAP